MSEEATIESQCDAETQQKATDMGWIGPSKFKGAPEKFIDADKFIEHAETFVPFLKKDRERLANDLAAERAARAADKASMDSQLTELKTSLDNIEERYTVETQKRVEGARKELKASIKAAADEGDLKAVVALTSELDDLNETERAALAEETKARTKAAETKAQESKVEISEQYKAEITTWVQAHTWINTDKKRSALFFGFCEARRAGGDLSQGKAFFDSALEDMEEALEKQETTKVESGKNGSGQGGGGSGGKGKSYGDMPADARAACDKDANKFVGKGKKYADKAAWQKSYAEIYFSME